jgi:hypothetical protein
LPDPQPPPPHRIRRRHHRTGLSSRPPDRASNAPDRAPPPRSDRRRPCQVRHRPPSRAQPTAFFPRPPTAGGRADKGGAEPREPQGTSSPQTSPLQSRGSRGAPARAALPPLLPPRRLPPLGGRPPRPGLPRRGALPRALPPHLLQGRRRRRRGGGRAAAVRGAGTGRSGGEVGMVRAHMSARWFCRQNSEGAEP